MRAGELPKRVVSLGGAITEVIFDLGRQDALVGRDMTSMYPPEAMRLPDVGYVRRLSAEGILGLRPDLVIAIGEAGPPGVLRQIEAAGVKVATVPGIHSFDGIIDMIREVAAVLGVKEPGDALVARFDADRRAAEALVGKQGRVKAVYIMSQGPGGLAAAGEGTAADEMLRLSGLENVITGYKGYKPVSAESLIGLAPEVIVTGTRTVGMAGGPEKFVQNPVLSQTPAAKEGRVVVMDDMYLLGFGPRSARAAMELAKAARP